jgi:WD40 repeat protein
LNDTLASSSDDNSIRVWNLSSINLKNDETGSNNLIIDSSIQLKGHLDKVRALLFPHCLPFHLISGGWDKSIRLWHFPSQSCVFVCFEHQSDVYGLSSHIERPGIVVSCSRDSTLRVWSLEEKLMEITWRRLIDKVILLCFIFLIFAILNILIQNSLLKQEIIFILSQILSFFKVVFNDCKRNSI